MKTNRATLRRLLVSVCLALLTAPLGRAQVATGPVPFGSFSGGSFDAVNNANLNVHFAIPVISKAGRGLPFDYSLSYDTSVWYPSAGAWTTVANWGWRGVTEAETGYVSYRTFQLRCRVCDPNTGICGYSYYPSYDTWTYHDSLGAGHGFKAPCALV